MKASGGLRPLPAGAPTRYVGAMTTRRPEDWLTETEERLLDQAVRLAPERGWNERLVADAGKALGLGAPDLELVLPRGAADLAALFSRRHDQQALAELGTIDVSKLKVRERIATAVETRLDVAMRDEAAVRAVRDFLLRPAHAPLALRLGWETADRLWRWAGDTATDENHYSKRAILGGVLFTTTAVRLASGPEAARRHLSAQVDRVMAFETWKAKSAPRPSEWGKAAAGMLGRLRYGARHSDSHQAP